jgi:hypothetical protein
MDGRSSALDTRHEGLIRSLAAQLRPVRRLPPPAMRALAWLACVAAVASALAPFADVAATWRRLVAAPDLLLAALGAIATAGLAAIAAFELSLPDRRRAWALLPAPALLLWIGASGAGCLRAWLAPATHVAGMDEVRDCLMFILGVSAPLSAVLILMLRRAHPLSPALTAATAGLAAAAAAAALLNLIHPFDAALTDLLVHAVAVALVVAAARALGARSLRHSLATPAAASR